MAVLKHRIFDLWDAAPLVIRHVQSSPGREVCGVILSDGSVVQFENQSAEHDRFSMGVEFEEYRDRATAIYHSHVGWDVGAELSENDIAASKELQIPYLVYHPLHQHWDYFDPGALHPYPMYLNSFQPHQTEYYLMWKFEYGRSDCYSLVRAWYAGKLGIEMGDYPREDLNIVMRSNVQQFSDARITEQDFVKLPGDSPIQDHDVLLIDLGSRSQRGHHLAIVSDAASNQILHNLAKGQISTILVYGTYWRERTRAIFRHKSLV